MPLYHQIYLQLRDEIVGGQRAPGTTLPTEQELSAQFGVSRITARRVLYELAARQLVERRRRVGTTVIHTSPARPIEANIDQAVDSLLALSRSTTVRVLDLAEEPATAGVAASLRLGPSERVIRATRVRSLDDQPLGHVLSYVPVAFGGIVTRAALAATPMLQLLEAAGHRAGAAEQTIGATLADTALAAILGIEPRAALLRITRTVSDRAGAPILLTIAHYRSDRFTVRLDLQPPGQR